MVGEVSKMSSMSQGMVTGEIERLVDINSKGDNKLSL